MKTAKDVADNIHWTEGSIAAGLRLAHIYVALNRPDDAIAEYNSIKEKCQESNCESLGLIYSGLLFIYTEKRVDIGAADLVLNEMATLLQKRDADPSFRRIYAQNASKVDSLRQTK